MALLTLTALCFSQVAYAQTVPDDSSQASSDTTQSAPAPADAPTAVSSDPATQPNATVPLSDADASSSQDAPSSDVAPAAPEASSTSTAGDIEVQGSSQPLQDTANTQPAAAGDELGTTTNPQDATSTDALVSPDADNATTTVTPVVDDQPQATDTVQALVDSGATTTLDVVAQDIDSTPPPQVAEIIPAAKQEESVAFVPIKDAEQEPGFSFALTGKHIAAKKEVKGKDGQTIGEQAVTAQLSPQIDNSTGEVSVSGQCSDKYFVILLFKNQDDYANDPRSYIVNRAYPCVSGAFSYSISDLPASLADGTYYLLVGQQGDTGAWTPITSLTEITINRTQQ